MSESHTCRGHKGVSDPSELQLERVVSCPMRMLEFELRSSARSGVLTLGATSPVLYLLLLTHSIHREPREKPTGMTPGRGKT